MFAFAFILSAESQLRMSSVSVRVCECVNVSILTFIGNCTPTDSVGSSITTIAHWTIGGQWTAAGNLVAETVAWGSGRNGERGARNWAVAQAVVASLITFGKRKCKRVLKMPKETSSNRICSMTMPLPGAMPLGR